MLLKCCLKSVAVRFPNVYTAWSKRALDVYYNPIRQEWGAFHLHFMEQ